MSRTKFTMTGENAKSIREVAGDLRREIKAELVSEICREMNGAEVIVLLFEKYYLRNGSYAGLTVMLTECGDEKTADVVGFGGGGGMVNWSFGANADFAKQANIILQKYGFSVE